MPYTKLGNYNTIPSLVAAYNDFYTNQVPFKTPSCLTQGYAPIQSIPVKKPDKPVLGCQRPYHYY